MSKSSVNSFMQFSRVERPRIQAAHPHFSLADVSAELGRRWQLLSADERHRLKLAAEAAAAPASLSAVDWLDHVKVALGEAEFADLLHTLAQFKARAIDVRDVTLRVAALLHGRRELILGFNAFLPADVAVTPAMLDEHDRLRPDALPPRRTPSPAADGAATSSTTAALSRDDANVDVDDVVAVVDEVIAKAAAAPSSPSSASSTPRRRRPRSVELRAPASIGEQASAFAARLNAELDVRLRSNFVALLESVVEKERSVADFANKASTLFANNAQLADELFAFLPLHTATLLAALALPASPAPPTTPTSRAHTLRAGTADSPGAAGDGAHRHRRHEAASPRAQTMRGHRKASKSPSSHASHASPAAASLSSPALNTNRKKTRE